MKPVQAMNASVMYQGVVIDRDVNFLHADTENAVLAVDAPMPVATELAVEVSFAEQKVMGLAIVTKIQEKREASTKGQMHIRWVEFADVDLDRFSSWLAQTEVITSSVPEAAPSSSAIPETAEMDASILPEVTMPMAISTPESEANLTTTVHDVPPVVYEEEVTQQMDASTQLDMPVVSDTTVKAKQLESITEEVPPAAESENGDTEGGDKKKRRRRRK